MRACILYCAVRVSLPFRSVVQKFTATKAKLRVRPTCKMENSMETSNADVKEEPTESLRLRKLFLGGLSVNTTEQDIEDTFSKFGEIVDCIVIRESARRDSSGPPKSRGFGFVTYQRASEANEVLATRKREKIKIGDRDVDIKRAMPQEESQRDPTVNEEVRKIYIRGIGSLREDDFKEYFSKYGHVKDIIIPKMAGDSDRVRGFCFVEFDDPDIVDTMVAMKEHEIGGVRLEVKKASPVARRGDRDSGRFGPSRGGFGGRNEGGRGFGGRDGGGRDGRGGYGSRDLGDRRDSRGGDYGGGRRGGDYRDDRGGDYGRGGRDRGDYGDRRGGDYGDRRGGDFGGGRGGDYGGGRGGDFSRDRDYGRDTYIGTRDNYGGGRDSYGGGGGRDNYGGGGGRDSYGGGRDGYSGGRDNYGGGRDNYGGGRDGYGGGRDNYGGRGDYGRDRDYGDRRDNYGGGRNDGGGGRNFDDDRYISRRSPDRSYGGGGGGGYNDGPVRQGGGGYGNGYSSTGGGGGGGGGYDGGYRDSGRDVSYSSGGGGGYGGAGSPTRGAQLSKQSQGSYGDYRSDSSNFGPMRGGMDSGAGGGGGSYGSSYGYTRSSDDRNRPY